MKKILKWLNVNKAPVFGSFALLLYYLDSIFNITERLHLQDGWYYTLATFFVVLIGYSIKGKGFQKIITEILTEEKKLTEDEQFQEQKQIIDDIIRDSEVKTEEQKVTESNNKDQTA